MKGRMHQIAEMGRTVGAGHRWMVALTATLILSWPFPAQGQQQTESGAARPGAISIPANRAVVAKVDEYLNAATKAKRFGGTVLIARNGQVVVSKGYGMANIEDGVPNSSRTKFRLGSVTKQFTAMAVMISVSLNACTVFGSESVCQMFAAPPPNARQKTIESGPTRTSSR